MTRVKRIGDKHSQSFFRKKDSALRFEYFTLWYVSIEKAKILTTVHIGNG